MLTPINRILGLDPATKCGWSTWIIDTDTWESGVWNLAASSHQGAGMRWVHLRMRLAALLDEFRPQVVAFEEVVAGHSGTTAGHVYGGAVAHIEELCESAGVPYQGVNVGTVKTVAVGRASAAKRLVTAAGRERWPSRRKLGADEIDARFVALAWAVRHADFSPE